MLHIHGQSLAKYRQLSYADSINYAQPDSALAIYGLTYKTAKAEKDTNIQIHCLHNMGDIHFDEMNLSAALELITEALFLSEEKNIIHKFIYSEIKLLPYILCIFTSHNKKLINNSG